MHPEKWGMKNDIEHKKLAQSTRNWARGMVF
jgi:hypothetical protein